MQIEMPFGLGLIMWSYFASWLKAHVMAQMTRSIQQGQDRNDM